VISPAGRAAWAALAALLVAGCPGAPSGAPRPPPPPAEPPPPQVAPTKATAPVEEAFGGPWITFHSTGYRGDEGSTGGPEWRFTSAGLPAVSADGTAILVTRTDLSYGSLPNLRLEVIRAADEAVLSSVAILDQAEFAAAGLDPTAGADAVRRSFDDLRAKVRARVIRENAALTAAGWVSLTACRADRGPTDVDPPCSMREQQLQCGQLTRITYREPRLTLSVRNRTTTTARPDWTAPPVPRSGVSSPGTPVRGCFAGAWIDPARGWLVAHLALECQGGGDACSVPDRIHVLKLPEAPGPDEPPPAAPPCPRGMALVPAGEFTMGSTEGAPDEQPVHPVRVGAFCIDRTEVTVADYRACVDARRCFAPEGREHGCNWGAPGREAHPINCVPFRYADQFCAMTGRRLPTEAEWEIAARGAAGLRFPWGSGDPGGEVCWRRGSAGTCAAGASPGDRSPSGVLDLGGNVGEWTADLYAPYEGGPALGGHVLRGGAFLDVDPGALRGARRRTNLAPEATGFRCALSAR
jgi:formylglycine-generating enzyme required for sulfatase activity